MYIEEWLLEKILREEQERRSGYISMPRVHVPFRQVRSERFQKTDQELKAYEMPITKIILDQSVKELSQDVDNHFLDAAMYAYEHLYKGKK